MATTKIKFVTDSVADIPADLVEQWGITVVPCFVNYGGKSYADDGVELVREEYYASLGSMPDFPKTSAMPPDVARGPIEAAFQDADHIIIVTTPAKLSAIHNTMRLAASDLPQDRVTLIDSGTVSIAMGWQVLIGAEVAAETGDLAKTLAAIESVQKNLFLYATVSTMEFLRRSGRIGWATASIGELLQIKPVLQVIDGEVLPIARVRTFSRALDKVIGLVREHAPFDRLALLHINNPEGVEIVRERISDIMPPDTRLGLVNPAVGTHIGPGTVGLGGIRKGWKDAISA